EERPKAGAGAGGWVSTGEAGGSKKRRKRDKRKKVDEKEVQESIRQTMAAMEETGRRKKKKRRIEPQVGMVDEESNLLKITEFISTAELAGLLELPVTDLIRECLMLGLRVTINQRLEHDTIQLLAEEHGYSVEFIDQLEEEHLLEESEEEEEEAGELEPRPPVVTVMGHVDHGKTTLLDHIRHTRVAEGEAGGITQHIGAYEIEHAGRKITFLDTPGHEAFTAMRARGAQTTDIVVLVVAADDQVMPQTIEAIDHAKAAGVPIVVAINKMDKPGANAEKVRQQLADHGVLVEEWGGEVQSAEVSAKTGAGIDDLLEKILIASELLDLKAVREAPARGVVIESRLDKGRGTVCTVLVQRGTLHVGDVFVAGPYFGRVRAMFDEHGDKVKEAVPGQPVLITGFESAPHVGDHLVVFQNEHEAKELAGRRQLQIRDQEMRLREGVGKGDLLQAIDGTEYRELRLVIKGDVDGSVEAIADSLMRLSSDEVGVKIIHRSVGPINESDILLASASKAMVIGFNVHPNLKARELAQRNDVHFQTYRVIYELIEDIKEILKGMYRRETAEEVVGTLEVRNLFKISRIGTIAGCYVLQGKIERTNQVRILRDGTEVYTGTLESLKRFKEDVREVAQGFECGVKIAGFNDIKVGDTIEAFVIVEVDREIEVG
ncbi:MAG TPA: translation initiation factor IF-2, partial [Bacteroidetes bacterium]|nr:translation initiation factor IF-2 [Bacteroidota bacterium]